MDSQLILLVLMVLMCCAIVATPALIYLGCELSMRTKLFQFWRNRLSVSLVGSVVAVSMVVGGVLWALHVAR
jgi:hypothetical protein